MWSRFGASSPLAPKSCALDFKKLSLRRKTQLKCSAEVSSWCSGCSYQVSQGCGLCYLLCLMCQMPVLMSTLGHLLCLLWASRTGHPPFAEGGLECFESQGAGGFGCYLLCSFPPPQLIFPLFAPPQLEGDKLALPVSPSPVSPAPTPSPKPPEAAVLTVEPSPSEKKCFFVDEAEPLLRCDSTSSGSSALSRTGSFITKGTKSHPGQRGKTERAPWLVPCGQRTW